MEDKTNKDTYPGLAQLTQTQIEYLLATVHGSKDELDKLFEKSTPVDLLVIVSYLSAVLFTGSKESQILFEQFTNLFMNMYPQFLEDDLKENGDTALAPGDFRIVIPKDAAEKVRRGISSNDCVREDSYDG